MELDKGKQLIREGNAQIILPNDSVTLHGVGRQELKFSELVNSLLFDVKMICKCFLNMKLNRHLTVSVPTGQRKSDGDEFFQNKLF